MTDEKQQDPESGPGQGSLDRAQLISRLDQYLDAIVADTTAGVALAAAFRETQNAVETAPGEGLWESAKRIGTGARYADPVAGEAGFYGIIDEDRSPAITGLRIRVGSDGISEAEWIIARVGMTFYNVYGLQTNLPRQQLPTGVEPAARDAAIRAVESYFDGIAAADGSRVLAHSHAYRIENGSLNVGPLPGAAQTHDRPAGDGVTSALAPGITGVTNRFEDLRTVTDDVIDRRFFYDEAAGVVWSHGTFARVAGAVNRVTGDPVPWLNFFEIFQIDDDRIAAIHAAMNYLPRSITDPGWLPSTRRL